LNWTAKSFEELSNKELYDILALRSEVFIVEQTCAYQDIDGKDLKAIHLFASNENENIMAYARLLPPGISYVYPSIGRVVTHSLIRRSGIGKLLMQKSIEILFEKFGKQTIKISAQLYLQNFYESFGFTVIGESYLEDDIPHIAMMLHS
jgi:ElaA protein